MLKTCPSCSYIGNDGERVCPFCKSDLSIGKPKHSARRDTDVSASVGEGHQELRSFGGKRTVNPGLIACFFKREDLALDVSDAEIGELGFLPN